MMGLGVEGKQVLLINTDGAIHAYTDACPHKRTRLSQGSLRGTVLTCATHHWEFDVCTGLGVNPADARLEKLAVRIEDGGILLDLEQEGRTEGIPHCGDAIDG